MPKPLSETILQAGLDTLLAQMEKITLEAETGGEVKPAELERIAKAISSHLKAVDDLTAHHSRKLDNQKARKYTAYSDLPPPSPEERAQFIKKLEKLYAAIDLDGAIKRASRRHERKRSHRDEP